MIPCIKIPFGICCGDTVLSWISLSPFFEQVIFEQSLFHWVHHTHMLSQCVHVPTLKDLIRGWLVAPLSMHALTTAEPDSERLLFFFRNYCDCQCRTMFISTPRTPERYLFYMASSAPGSKIRAYMIHVKEVARSSICSIDILSDWIPGPSDELCMFATLKTREGK